MDKAFIFDFDGSVAASMPLIQRILADYAPQYGVPVPDEALLQEWRGLTAQEFMRRYKLSWLQISRIVWNLRRDMKAELLDVPPVEGMKAILLALQEKAEVYLMSSNSKDNLDRWLQRHLPEVRFRVVVGGVSLMGKAPSLRRLKKEFGLDGSETFYVGDEVRDVQASRTAGVKAVAVAWGMQTRERLESEVPDYLLDEPAGLLQLV